MYTVKDINYGMILLNMCSRYNHVLGSGDMLSLHSGGAIFSTSYVRYVTFWQNYKTKFNKLKTYESYKQPTD